MNNFSSSNSLCPFRPYKQRTRTSSVAAGPESRRCCASLSALCSMTQTHTQKPKPRFRIVQFSTPEQKTKNMGVVAKYCLGIYLMKNKWILKLTSFLSWRHEIFIPFKLNELNWCTVWTTAWCHLKFRLDSKRDNNGEQRGSGRENEWRLGKAHVRESERLPGEGAE